MTRALTSARHAVALVATLAATPLWSQPAGEQDFFLGVQTHFVQGWRLEFLDLLPQLGASSLRDELSWPLVERAQGRYFFNHARTRYLDIAIARGLDPLLLFTDTHPDYDGGQTPHSHEAQTALARYVAATLDNFAPGLRRIEIGNEFNSEDFVSGPFKEDRARYFAAMLRVIHDTVKQQHPDTEILCTGTHSVAIGFFRALFEQGVLESCDAISLHLYREQPEGLKAEIDRLRALMAEFGTVLPIYVTEFGKWFDEPEDAPEFMLKSVMQMGDVGIAGAWWYALLDQPWWPNMGLYRPDPTEAMPAADSFRLLQEQLLPLGRPRLVGATSADQIYALGEPARAVVAWGAPGQLSIEGAERFLNASGQEIAPVSQLDHAPVVILGDNLKVDITRDHTLVDVRYGFGHAPWSYHAKRPDGTETPLVHMDWEWASFLGDPWLRPLLVTQDWISGTRFDTGAYKAAERFTATETGAHDIAARWFLPQESELAGATVSVRHNGSEIAQGSVTQTAFHFGPKSIALVAGDQIDFVVGPSNVDGNHAVRREITIKAPRAQ